MIATLIHHPEFYFQAEELLPQHFYEPDNRVIYTAISLIAKDGVRTVDAYNIIEYINSTPGTRAEGAKITHDQIRDLIDLSITIARSSPEEYKTLAHNIINMAFRRDMLHELRRCTQQTLDLNTPLSTSDLSKEVYDSLDTVITGYSIAGSRVTEFRDKVDDLWQEIVERQEGKSKGIPFKFPSLGDFVQIESGELIVVGAPAKGAKSMFMLNEAVDILRQGKSVMYLDSELSSRLFLCRMVSHLTGIEFSRVRSGRYSEEENERIKEQLAWIKQQHFIHIYMPIFNKSEIYTAVKKADHMFDGLDVLIVDYLKPTGSSNEAYTVYAELGALTDCIKNEICGNMGIAGLAAAQLTSTNKLADSAKIARNASTIMLMIDKTPEEIEMDGEGSGRKKLIVAQNRNGMQHVDGEWINLDFNGNICLLEEAATKHYLEEPF